MTEARLGEVFPAIPQLLLVLAQERTRHCSRLFSGAINFQIVHHHGRGDAVARLGRQPMRVLKVSVGDRVTARRVQIVEARRVVLEPLAPLSRAIQAYEEELADDLAQRQALVQAGMLLPAQLPDFRREVYFRVLSATPERAVVGVDTRIVLRTSLLPTGATANLVTFDDVGGLGTEVDQLRELVECPLLLPADLRPAGHRAAPRNPAARPPRCRQDAPGSCHRERDRRALPLRQRT